VGTRTEKSSLSTKENIDMTTQLTREEKDAIQAEGYAMACEDLKNMSVKECIAKIDSKWPTSEFHGYTPFNFNMMLGYATRIKEQTK
jgi:hypothetical protein